MCKRTLTSRLVYSRYINAEEIDGETFWGQSAYYPGGGFLVRLDGNMNDSIKKLTVCLSHKVEHFDSYKAWGTLSIESAPALITTEFLLCKT